MYVCMYACMYVYRNKVMQHFDHQPFGDPGKHLSRRAEASPELPNLMGPSTYPRAQICFLLGLYTIIPKTKTSHKQKELLWSLWVMWI